MLPTPIQIRDKLLKELDDNNEVDEPTVVEMVSVLEKYPVTRATLEETKIGKMVNDLRRKIKNEKLAKRIKQLVRNWQKVLKETPPLNGSPGQTLGKLQLSPAVSPSPASARSSPSVSRLVSPAQLRGKPNTPTLNTYQSASPALQSSKSGAVVGRKSVLPATGPDQPASLRLQNVSPALAAGRPRALTPSVSGRVASPLVSGKAPSPAIPRHVSPGLAMRTLAAGTGKVASPALGRVKGQSSPLMASSPVQSPALHLGNHGSGTSSKQEFGKGSTKLRFRKKDAGVSDSSNLGRMTPTSVHSENSQDRVIGEIDNGKQDSDGESSCSSSRTGQSRHAYSLSHSTDTSTNTNTKRNGKNSVKDQRELSKTNVANRKRARRNSSSPPETHKKSRVDSPSLSYSSHRPEKVVNGHKKSKRSLPGADIPHVSSCSSLWPLEKSISPPVLSNPSSDSRTVPPQSDVLLHQEIPDSFDRPIRDKHKVKTTEQLIQDLQKKNSSSNVGDSIMTKLRTNQIERERDVPESVLPPSMKPRGKRGKQGKNDDISVSVPSSDVKFSKNELVERFLKTSDPSPSVDEYNPFRDDPLPTPAREPRPELRVFSSFSKDSFDGNYSSRRQNHSESAPQDERSMDAIPIALPSTSQSDPTGSALTLQQIYAQLPPIDDDIDWDSVGFYELPEPTPVTDEYVDRLHSDRLPGINGMYDINGDWTTWQQTITLPSYEDDPLHVLPYVDLDN